MIFFIALLSSFSSACQWPQPAIKKQEPLVLKTDCPDFGVDTATSCCPASDSQCISTVPVDFFETEGRAFPLQLQSDTDKKYRFVLNTNLSEYYCKETYSKRPHLSHKLNCPAPQSNFVAQKTRLAPPTNDKCFNAKQVFDCIKGRDLHAPGDRFDISTEGLACRKSLPENSNEKYVEFVVWLSGLPNYYSCHGVKRPIYINHTAGDGPPTL